MPAEVAYHVRMNSKDRYRGKGQQYPQYTDTSQYPQRCRGAMEKDEDNNQYMWRSTVSNTTGILSRIQAEKRCLDDIRRSLTGGPCIISINWNGSWWLIFWKLNCDRKRRDIRWQFVKKDRVNYRDPWHIFGQREKECRNERRDNWKLNIQGIWRYEGTQGRVRIRNLGTKGKV